MSDESNAVLSTEKHENGIMKENTTKPALQSDLSPSRAKDVSAEQVHIRESREQIEPAELEEQNKPILGRQEQVGNVESVAALDSHDTKYTDTTEFISFEKKVDVNEPDVETTSEGFTETKSLGKTVDANETAVETTYEGSTETKSLGKTVDANETAVETTSEESTETKSLGKTVRANETAVETTSEGSTETKSLGNTVDVNEDAVKSTTPEGSTESKSLVRASGDKHPSKEPIVSNEIPLSLVPSGKGLARVDKNIQLINEGLKDMKISPEGMPPSASAKKGPKPPTTPRARSTPVLTSPPLTRSRSRDLRKFPSTPSSPKISNNRKTRGSDSGETEARGRQRARKN